MKLNVDFGVRKSASDARDLRRLELWANLRRSVRIVPLAAGLSAMMTTF